MAEDAHKSEQMLQEIVPTPAILFSGQGSQQKGMGRELAESDGDAMARWIEAEKLSGLPLREIYWEGEEEEMSDTAAMQPALTTVHLNYWDALRKNLPIAPHAAAGHSLGEFSALAASGVISPHDALRITSLRGKLMAEADPDRKGSMAAIVRLDAPQVLEMVEKAKNATGGLLVAANFNAPNQTVISGTQDALAKAIELTKEMKGRGVELKVSGAFHSPLMEKANAELRPLLDSIHWNDPKFPVYCNVDGKPIHTGAAARKNIFRQMISPVFWVDLIRNLYIAGTRWWIEISPRAVLGKMIGPSVSGIGAQCDTLRVDLINSLNSILQASF